MTRRSGVRDLGGNQLKRIVAALLIAPIIWPWVLDLVATLVYIALTGTTIHHYWLAPLYNLHFFWGAYGIMALFGGPFVLLSLRHKWQRVWSYLVIGTAMGLVAPILYVAVVMALHTHQGEASGITLVLEVLQVNVHMISGTTAASGVMFFVYWAIGVKGNAVFNTAT